MKMSGDNPALDVYLGTQLIAKIHIINEQLYWTYSQDWRKVGYAVSPHLPLIDEIPSLNVLRFLKNLLPEGNALEELVANYHLSKNNIFALVRELGLDTPGSLIILSSNQSLPRDKTFRLLSNKELEERLNNRDTYGLIIWDGKPRLSVAGVQDKINVVLNEKDELGFGDGILCSTHLLKFEKHKYSNLVLNEYFSMLLAKDCGLNVADVQVKRFGPHPALLVKRFDRKLDSKGMVRRSHIIDGCQAMNLPPEYKYEQNFGNGRDVAHIRDGVSLLKLYSFTESCINPAKTKFQILDWVLFNILIYNCDAHGKNISFFVSKNGISLAPFYDLVNIKMYPEFQHELAMALGDEFDENGINAYQLADFADTCGLSRSLVTRRLKYLIGKIKNSLLKHMKLVVTDKKERSFLKNYAEIIIKRSEHLLEQSNYIASINL